MAGHEQCGPLFDPGLLSLGEDQDKTCLASSFPSFGESSELTATCSARVSTVESGLGEGSGIGEGESSVCTSGTVSDTCVDTLGSWERAPAIVLEHILQSMTYCERLCVTSVCKRWRSALYSPSLWQDITLQVDTRREGKKAYFLTKCIRFARHVKVHWPMLMCKGQVRAARPVDLHNKETLKALFEAMRNCVNLRTLVLKLENPCAFSPDFSQPVQNCLGYLLPQNHHLISLSFGCNATIIPPNIVDLIPGKSRIQELHIARYRPAYSTSNMDTVPVLSDNDYLVFCQFQHLKELTVDWCNVGPGLVQGLAQSGASHLTKLNLLVASHPCTTSAHPSRTDWQHFSGKHPNIHISLVFVRQFGGICESLGMIQPDVFLIKFLECDVIDIEPFVCLFQGHQSALQALVFAGVWGSIEQESGPVLWPSVVGCSRLRHLAITGHYVLDAILVFIVSHCQLDSFVVTKPHVMMYAEVTPYLLPTSASKYNHFKQELSAILGRPWEATNRLPLQGFYFAEGKDDSVFLTNTLK